MTNALRAEPLRAQDGLLAPTVVRKDVAQHHHVSTFGDQACRVGNAFAEDQVREAGPFGGVARKDECLRIPVDGIHQARRANQLMSDRPTP
jgi:hypothetical protein